jgi:type IV secretion system protein VirD4
MIPYIAGGILAIASAIGAWTVMASRMFVWMGGISAYFPSPWVTWWQYARQSKINGSTMLYLVASGIIAALPIAFVLTIAVVAYIRRLRKPLSTPPKGGIKPLERGPTDNHGHAQWLSKEQMTALYPGPEGMLIGATGRSPDDPLLIDSKLDGPTHNLIFAGPGSHKTVTAIHRIWLWPWSKVVFDPSTEIGPVMSRALRESGHNVHTIRLNGEGLNVLDWIDITDPETEVHIRSAVDWIYDEEAAKKSNPTQSKDPFWSEWGKSLVTCLMAHMLYGTDTKHPKTLKTLRRGIATSEDEMQERLRNINNNSNSPLARELAAGLMGMKAPQTFSGIYSNAFSATAWLSVDAYANLVSGNSMKTSDVLNPDTAVFIQLSLRTLDSTPAIGRAVLGALLNPVYLSDGEMQDRVLYMLDEAWIFGKMKEIMLCYATGRKYAATMSMIFPSEAIFESVWGEQDAKAMRDLCSWRSYAAIQDGQVADKLSADFGEHGVITYSEGDNQGRTTSMNSWGSRNRGDTVNKSEASRRLVKRDEILNAPSDVLFVRARDAGAGIMCYSAPYFRYPEVDELMDSNRFKKADHQEDARPRNRHLLDLLHHDAG